MSSKKTDNNDLISIIVNCYNEEETIEIFYKALIKVLTLIKNIDYELIFIDDNSKDKTLEVIKKLHKKNSRIRYLSMSRNFGKEQGIHAGYEYAKGDYIVTIDVDLQDPPVLIIEMYNILKKGEYDCVATRSVTRNGYSFFRKVFVSIYYYLLKKVSFLEMKEGIRDYRMINRKVLNTILSMREYSRYSRFLFAYSGYKTYWIEFINQNRSAGTTKWNFKKLLAVAFDAFLSSSIKILYLPIYLGVFALFLSLVFLVIYICSLYNNIFLIMMLFFNLLGILSLLSGINSLYISRIYLQSLNRPIYIINETEQTNENKVE